MTHDDWQRVGPMSRAEAEAYYKRRMTLDAAARKHAKTPILETGSTVHFAGSPDYARKRAVWIAVDSEAHAKVGAAAIKMGKVGASAIKIGVGLCAVGIGLSIFLVIPLWACAALGMTLVVSSWLAHLIDEVLQDTIPASQIEQRKLDWILGPPLPELPEPYIEPMLPHTSATMQDIRLRCMGCGEPMGTDCHRPGDTHGTSGADFGYCGGKLQTVRGGSPIDRKLSERYLARFNDGDRREAYKRWEPCLDMVYES